MAQKQHLKEHGRVKVKTRESSTGREKESIRRRKGSEVTPVRVHILLQHVMQNGGSGLGMYSLLGTFPHFNDYVLLGWHNTFLEDFSYEFINKSAIKSMSD